MANEFKFEESEVLKNLFEAVPTKKTITAKLNVLMPQIELKLSEGAKHEEILNVLNENGFNLTLGSFRTYLYRYRNKIKKVKKKISENNPHTENIVEDVSEINTGVGNDDNNGNIGNQNLTEVSAPIENEINGDSDRSIDDILNARTRDQVGDKYINQKRSIFRKK